jgi:hypothetical protein
MTLAVALLELVALLVMFCLLARAECEITRLRGRIQFLQDKLGDWARVRAMHRDR